MVGKIIREYLDGGHKKVTVPGFGTFMRKDSGEIIFVDLIRKDDGVLRELVEDYGRYSDVEAMALVDRFIFEIKHDIERNGSAPIDDFGTMFLDEKGLYQFDYSPKTTSEPAPTRETAVQENLFGDKKTDSPQTPKPMPQKPVQPRTVVQKPTPTSRPVAQRPAKAKTGKPDMWIVIAIVAAIIALAIIVYGLSGSSLPFLQ